MKEVVKRFDRSRQILKLLKTHGPLSNRSLLRMIDPEISKKKLLRALEILRRKNYVNRRFENLYSGKAYYYCLSQHPESLKEMANLLKLEPQELEQPHFLRRELLHSEICALWTYVLKKMFPEAEILRDFELNSSEKAKNIMLVSAYETELQPDLLLFFPKAGTQPETTVAVEIERSPKTKNRLYRKLRKYANGTKVDGLIYLCETDHIRNSILAVYNSKPFKQSKRIGHYGDNFLLYGDSAHIHTDSFLKMFNSRFETVFLPHWINYLCETRIQSRRDANFILGGLQPPQSN